MSQRHLLVHRAACFASEPSSKFRRVMFYVITKKLVKGNLDQNYSTYVKQNNRATINIVVCLGVSIDSCSISFWKRWLWNSTAATRPQMLYLIININQQFFEPKGWLLEVTFLRPTAIHACQVGYCRVLN